MAGPQLQHEVCGTVNKEAVVGCFVCFLCPPHREHACTLQSYAGRRACQLAHLRVRLKFFLRFTKTSIGLKKTRRGPRTAEWLRMKTPETKAKDH